MNKFFRRINRPISLSSASVLIAASLAVGFILGFIRTKLIYRQLQRLLDRRLLRRLRHPRPDLLHPERRRPERRLLIPVLSDKVFTANLKQAWRLTSSVLNGISLIMFLVSLTLVLFSPADYRASDRSPASLPSGSTSPAQIMRLAAINPLVFSIHLGLLQCPAGLRPLRLFRRRAALLQPLDHFEHLPLQGLDGRRRPRHRRRHSAPCSTF